MSELAIDPSEVVSSIMGRPTAVHVQPGGLITFGAKEETPCTLRQLKALADAFVTDEIRLVFEREEDAWSDVTGGSPSELYIEISKVRRVLEWEDESWQKRGRLRLRAGVIEYASVPSAQKATP